MNESTENSWPIKIWHMVMVFLTVLFISGFFAAFIIPEYFSDDPPPLASVFFEYTFYLLLCFFLLKAAKFASVNKKNLYGAFSSELLEGKFILPVLPLMGLSIFFIYMVFYPLTFLYPDFVNNMLLDSDSPMFWLSGDNHKLATILNFLGVGLVFPVVEEIFFRGFLLTSLAKKWNIKIAVIISSVLFGFMHVNIVGGIAFGMVASIFYLKTKSLYAPIILHVANNTLVFIFMYINTISGNNETPTIAEFQKYMWLAIAGAAIGIPWLIYFYRKEIKGRKFQLPYFTNMNAAAQQQ